MVPAPERIVAVLTHAMEGEGEPKRALRAVWVFGSRALGTARDDSQPSALFRLPRRSCSMSDITCWQAVV